MKKDRKHAWRWVDVLQKIGEKLNCRVCLMHAACRLLEVGGLMESHVICQFMLELIIFCNFPSLLKNGKVKAL